MESKNKCKFFCGVTQLESKDVGHMMGALKIMGKCPMCCQAGLAGIGACHSYRDLNLCQFMLVGQFLLDFDFNHLVNLILELSGQI